MSHIVVWRTYPTEASPIGYWHHGILCRDHSVIHYARTKTTSFRIERTPLGTFLRNSAPFSNDPMKAPVYIVRHPKAQFRSHQIEQRAESLLGSSGYNVLFNNCEHFARWCALGGLAISKQTATAAAAILTGTTMAGPIGGLVAAFTERLTTRFQAENPDYVPFHFHYLYGIFKYPQPASNQLFDCSGRESSKQATHNSMDSFRTVSSSSSRSSESSNSKASHRSRRRDKSHRNGKVRKRTIHSGKQKNTKGGGAIEKITYPQPPF